MSFLTIRLLFPSFLFPFPVKVHSHSIIIKSAVPRNNITGLVREMVKWHTSTYPSLKEICPWQVDHGSETLGYILKRCKLQGRMKDLQ